MRTFKLVTLALPLLLAACNLPKPKEKEGKTESVANFYMAGQVQGAVIAENIGGEFDLPVEKTYKFYACFRYQNYRDDVAGAKFLIKETGTEVKSNDSGCVSWAEKLPYNYLGDSTYVTIERTIEGKGLLKGSVKMKLALNPWSHGEKLADVIDLNTSNNTGAELKTLVSDKAQVGDTLQAKAFTNGKKIRRLWVEDGRYFAMEKAFENGKLDLEVEARITPQLKLSKMNGDPVMRPLTKGHFRSTIGLIHVIVKDGKEQHVFLGESAPIESQIVNGTLSIKSQLRLPYTPSRGQIFASIKIQPLKEQAGIQGFEGIYYVGEYDALKTSAFLKLSAQAAEDDSFSIKKFASVDIQTIMAGNDDEAKQAYMTPKVVVRQLVFARLDSLKESTTHRTVRYGVTACLANGVDQKIIRAHKFTVNKFRQSEKEVATQSSVDIIDNSSCLYFEDFFTIDYFGCQHYYPGFIDIMNKDLGVNERIQVLLNPWESWRIFGRDMRFPQNNEFLPVTCDDSPRQAATIQMNKYGYEQNSVTYSMDDQLNLTKIMHVQFNMMPMIKNMSNLYNGWDQVDYQRDGLYLLKFAIVKNKTYFPDDQVIYTTKEIVAVTAGNVSGLVDFKIKDLTALGNTNTVYVQILPIKAEMASLVNNRFIVRDTNKSIEDVIEKNTELRSPVFTGIIKLSKEAESFELRPVNYHDLTGYFMNDTDKSVKSIVDKNGNEWFQALETLEKQQQAAEAKKVVNRSKPEALAQDANLKLVHMNSIVETASLRKAMGALALPLKLGMLSDSATPKYYESFKAQAAYDDLGAIKDLMSTGKLKPDLARQLCVYWFQDFMQNEKINGKSLLKDYGHVNLTRDCYSAVTRNPEKFFLAEKRLIVKKSRMIEQLPGSKLKYSVGSSFSISNSHSDSFSRSLGLSASVKALDFFNVGLSGSYGLQWSTADALGVSNSVSVGTSNSLEVEKNSFRILLDKYEQCLIVRLNPNLFVTNTNVHFVLRDQNYTANLNSELTADQKASAKTRGLLLCDGEDSKKILLKTENYYFIDGDEGTAQQDHGDQRNRPFVLQVRGEKDFKRFEIGAKLIQKNPDTAQAEDSIPSNQLDQTIRLFNLGLPVYPGQFIE